MRSLLRTVPCKIVSSLTAFMLLFSSVFSVVPRAYAAPAAPATALATAAEVPPIILSAPTPGSRADTDALPARISGTKVGHLSWPSGFDSTKADTPTIVRELTERATATSRSYLLSNGMTRVVYYSGPVNYTDPKTQTMKPIDAGLQDAEISGRTVSTNRKNAFRLQLPRTLSGDWVSLETSDTQVALRPAYRAGAARVAFAPQTGVSAVSRTATAVAYAAAFAGASLSYVSEPEGLKETITLSAPTSATVFSFDLKLAGLTPNVQQDGSISLVRAGETSASLTVPAPVMWDSSETTTSWTNSVHYELSGTGPAYRLDVVPDAAWLSDPARTYPVMIDPSVLTTVCTPADTYVSSGSSGSKYSTSNVVNVNNHATGYDYTDYGVAQASPAFDADLKSKMDDDQTVYSASLAYDCSSVNAPGTVTAYNVDWTAGTVDIPNLCWSNRPTVLDNIGSTQTVTSGWNTFDITKAAVFWQTYNGSNTSDNILLANSSGGRVVFQSKEYVTPSHRPVMTVNYAPLPEVELLSPEGEQDWTALGASWTYSESLGNPQVEYYAEVDDASGTVLASRDTSSSATSATLPVPLVGWVPGQTYTVKVRAASRPMDGGAVVWSATSSSTFVYRPIPVSVATTASPWFQEPDSNGDGVADSGENTGTAGRGSAVLSWEPADGADHYRVYLFDGNTYRAVATTTANAWSTAGAGLYPSDAQIASLALNYTGNPYLVGSGLDLRDDPMPLYAKTASATVDGIPAYFFKVTGVNADGETPLSSAATITVQLPARTIHASEDAAKTTYDLGDFAGGDHAQVELNTGVLTISSTDLAINSYGPLAAVSRTYRSDSAFSTFFGVGWRFNFEQSISSVSSSSATYTDARGLTHRFVGNGQNTWVSPHSIVATLTYDSNSATYSLFFKGGERLTFDGTGRLSADTDRHGQSVTYAWNGYSTLTITAANGQAIVVAFASRTRIANATYSAGGQTRSVSYTSIICTSVTRVGGLYIEYAYSPYPGSQISTISAPNATVVGVPSVWTASYDASGALTGFSLPHPGDIASRLTAVSYDWANAAATVSYPSRVGSASADTTVAESVNWDPTGREIAHGNQTALGATCEGTTTTDYAPSGVARLSVTAGGVIADQVSDARGNVLLMSDALGSVTTGIYNSSDDLISSTDPKGSVTTYTYNNAGDALAASRTLSPTQSSMTSCTYDAQGRLLSEGDLIDSVTGARAYTTYSYDPRFTSPTQVVQRGVALSSTATVDLTSTWTLDDFGQPLTYSDPVGPQIIATTYDIAGYLRTQKDATGTVTTHDIDAFGHENRQYRISAAGVYGAYVWRGVDPTGLVLSEIQEVDITQMWRDVTTQHYYDGAGNEIKASSSDVGTTTTAYDAQGDVSMQWTPDVTTLTTATAQVTTTSPDGNVIASQSGTQAAEVTTYYAGTDLVASQTAPAVDPVGMQYNENGELTTLTVPTDDGTTATITTGYDIGGRAVMSTDASGNVTLVSYDLLGRSLATVAQATGRGQCATYNTLGWALTTTDANGITTKFTYDRDGRVTDRVESIAGAADAVMHADYDAMGNMTYLLNPDGTSSRATYDAFGRQIARKEWAANGTLAHDVGMQYDMMNRSTATSDAAVSGGLTTNLTYAEYLGTNDAVTHSGTTTRTATANPVGNETGLSLSVSGSSLSITANRDIAQKVTSWKFTAPTGTDKKSSVAYDSAGRIQTETVGLGLTTAYRYVGTGRRSVVDLPAAGDIPHRVSGYSYTDAGRLTSVVTTVGDGAGQTSTTTPYAFDDAGSITRAGATTFAYAGAQLASSSVGAACTTYTFDARGRRTGQASPDASATFTWDTHADRLLKYTRRVHGSQVASASFAYDASGQRTRSVVTSGSVTTTTTYTYEGLSLFRTVAASPSMTTTLTYLYDEFGRATALAAETSGTAGVTYLRVSTTDRGDVMFLTDILSSGAGTATVTGAWAYDAWGNPTITSAPRGDSIVPTAVASAIATAQVLRYAGYVYDSFSGLYYCSQRYLDPATMQFISPDAARADGEQSAYQYCIGDPVNRMDVTGAAADWFDAGKATAADSAINAFRRAKKRALRNYFLALAKARAKAESKRARARMAAEIAAEKRWKAARAAAKAKALAAMRAAVAASEAEAQAWADAARTDQYLAWGAMAVGAVDFVVGAEAAAPIVAAWMVGNGMGALAGAGGAAGAAKLAADAADDGANCFISSTPVLTAAGFVPIGSVRPGDVVLSRDERTGAQSLKPVVRTMVHQTSALVHVRTAVDTITCTPNHPFWVQGRGWVDAGDLRFGDTLVLADGGRADIVSVTREKLASPLDVYNLEVEGYHTYFVASASVWVHNCGGYSGGTYGGLDAAEGIERHHLIADSISPLSRSAGPAIQMDTADHYMTGSWGNSSAAQAYRAAQSALVNDGNLDGAFDMDVSNIRSLFASKYDIAIQQARAAAQWR